MVAWQSVMIYRTCWEEYVEKDIPLK